MNWPVLLRAEIMLERKNPVGSYYQFLSVMIRGYSRSEWLVI